MFDEVLFQRKFKKWGFSLVSFSFHASGSHFVGNRQHLFVKPFFLKTVFSKTFPTKTSDELFKNTKVMSSEFQKLFLHKHINHMKPMCVFKLSKNEIEKSKIRNRHAYYCSKGGYHKKLQELFPSFGFIS